MTPEQIRQLSAGANELGIELSDQQLGRFDEFASLLEEWNKKFNLTRIAPERVVSLHFLDSLALVRVADLTTTKKIIDVGTGAGFPGIPLAIALPHLKVTVLDSTQKKLRFVHLVCQSLELADVKIVNARAEETANVGPLREAFDIATARAVAPMEVLVEWLLPFVKVGGQMIALKSDKVEDELRECHELIYRLGGAAVNVVEIPIPGEIPGTEITRKMVVIQKTGETPKKYPRLGLKRHKG